VGRKEFKIAKAGEPSPGVEEDKTNKSSECIPPSPRNERGDERGFALCTLGKKIRKTATNGGGKDLRTKKELQTL